MKNDLQQLLTVLKFLRASKDSDRYAVITKNTLKTVITCIEDLQNERADLREWVESEVSMDTWVKIANKYGWE